tara:strand:- start:118333 stop:119130 length:798 start_codon:yes stop_codon:yes gene_type:complete
MKDKDTNFIGFPPDLLGKKPQRLKIFYADEAKFLLEKPSGILAQPHPWYPQKSAITEGLRTQLEAKKPELERLNIQDPYLINMLDVEASGAILLGLGKESSDSLRNLLGSQQIKFTYHFLARPWKEVPESFSCDLPLAPHSNKSCMRISRTDGKQTETTFKRLERYGSYQLWEAQTCYNRLHQIRIHAHKSGLSIVGERRYCQEPPIFLSQLKRNYRGKDMEKPLYPYLCLHLAKIALPTQNWEVEIPHPSRWTVLIKKLKEFCG